jgi:Pyruvate/2-oxoacid:ferredoxin oxidoreductase delta subunit
MGKACSAPWDVCLTFDDVAHSIAQRGHARLISYEEGLDALERSYANNLVQIGENVRERPSFICNCCGCCCEALQAARRFGPLQPVATTNYLPKLDPEQCTSCGRCSQVCPILAITMEELPVINEEICLGCGVCARSCPQKAIRLEKRPVQIITPVNNTHRFVLQAIEKGTLQNLIFDNQAFASHRAMAAVLGVILKLPPLQQALASKQFKSVYLDKLLAAKH